MEVLLENQANKENQKCDGRNKQTNKPQMYKQKQIKEEKTK